MALSSASRGICYRQELRHEPAVHQIRATCCSFDSGLIVWRRVEEAVEEIEALCAPELGAGVEIHVRDQIDRSAGRNRSDPQFD